MTSFTVHLISRFTSTPPQPLKLVLTHANFSSSQLLALFRGPIEDCVKLDGVGGRAKRFTTIRVHYLIKTWFIISSSIQKSKSLSRRRLLILFTRRASSNHYKHCFTTSHKVTVTVSSIHWAEGDNDMTGPDYINILPSEWERRPFTRNEKLSIMMKRFHQPPTTAGTSC